MRLSAKWRVGSRADYLALGSCDFEPISMSLEGQEVIRIGEGTPIVLVPGLAGGWRLLAPLAMRLAEQGYEAILCGHRGETMAMPSRRPERIADLAVDLRNLFEALRLERPIVFGISFGGAVALEWAVANPSRVGGLILHGVESRFRPNFGSIVTRHVLERYPLPRDNGFLNQFFNILHGCKPEPGPLVDFVVQRCWETDQGVVAQRLRLLEDFDVTDRLDRIEAPTLVMAGSRDVVVPPARQQALARAIADSRYVEMEGAGHIGFLTHGDELVRQIGRMMREQTLAHDPF